jgi:hypothetical protein
VYVRMYVCARYKILFQAMSRVDEPYIYVCLFSACLFFYKEYIYIIYIHIYIYTIGKQMDNFAPVCRSTAAPIRSPADEHACAPSCCLPNHHDTSIMFIGSDCKF